MVGKEAKDNERTREGDRKSQKDREQIKEDRERGSPRQKKDKQKARISE